MELISTKHEIVVVDLSSVVKKVMDVVEYESIRRNLLYDIHIHKRQIKNTQSPEKIMYAIACKFMYMEKPVEFYLHVEQTRLLTKSIIRTELHSSDYDEYDYDQKKFIDEVAKDAVFSRLNGYLDIYKKYWHDVMKAQHC